MKKVYCTIQRLLAVVIFAAVLVSCSQDLTYHEAISKNQRKIDDPDRMEDARFIVEARSFNILETKLAELAAGKGYAAKVVSLAKRDLENHEDLERELEKLASKERMVIPDNMNDEHQAILFEVTKAERQDFDREYIQALERINNDIQRRFTTMATQAKDGDIRAFAARKLDLLRNQEKLLSEVEDELLDTY